MHTNTLGCLLLVNIVNKMAYDIEDFKKSSFNEAALKMLRIHELQKIINLCSLNMKGIFMTEGDIGIFANGQRNYEVHFKACCQLYQEIRTKAKETERKSIDSKQSIIAEFIRSYSVFEYVDKINNKQEIFNPHVWVVLEKYLIEFENSIRDLADKHGFSGRDEDNPGLAIIRN